MSTFTRKLLLLGCSAIAIMAARGLVLAQEETPQEGGQGGAQPLPPVTVTAPKQVPKQAPKRAAPKAVPKQAPAVVRVPAPAPTPEQVQQAANRTVVQQTTTFDQRRDTIILPKVGANVHELTPQDVQAVPQGDAAQLRDFVLQFPGAYQDSKASGDFHIRNDHANVQFRINGILLPDSVSGYSQLMELGFISGMRPPSVSSTSPPRAARNWRAGTSGSTAAARRHLRRASSTAA